MQEQFFVSDVSKHYNLRHHNEGKPSPIYLVLRIFNKQYKIPLGVKVMPQHWRKDKAMISAMLTKLDNENNNGVNKTILEYDGKYMEFISYLCSNPNELDNVKNIIATIFGMKRKSNKPLAIAVLRTLLREKPMSDNARYAFDKQLDAFYDYLKTLKKDIYMEDIDVRLMKDYLHYLHNQKCTHRHTGEKVYIEDNTVRTMFGNILTILSYAETADILDLTKIKKLKEKGRDKTEENQVYLNDAEIEKLKSLSLTGEEDDIRDIFLFQLEIGQRISDVENFMGINLEDKIMDGQIELIQKKTGTRVYPPISEYSISILKKHNYTFPTYGNAKMNKCLKIIGKKANIDEPCQCREMRNGNAYIYNVPKYMLIGTHTARRSFISNSIKEGINTTLIKGVTGHTSESAFQRYDRVSNKEKASAFAKIKNKALQGSGNNKANNVPQDNIPAKSSAFPEEIKGVLTMLNVPPVEWVMLDDVESLYRVLITNENKICDKLGCDYKYLKDLWNNPELSLRDKITIITNQLSKNV